MAFLHFVKVSIVFALAIEACPSRETMFKRNTSLANWVHPDHLLFQSSARSGLGCAKQCSETPSCVSFTYPGSLHTPGTCRGHSTRHFSVRDAEPSVGVSTFLTKEAVPTNVAVHKPASQSSTNFMEGFPAMKAMKANDGRFSNLGHLDCAYTQSESGKRSWWQVDLEACFAILSVTITTRRDAWEKKLGDFDIDVYDKDPEIYPEASSSRCFHHVGSMPDNVTEEFVCGNQPIAGRVIRVTNAREKFLTLCEVQVMALP